MSPYSLGVSEDVFQTSMARWRIVFGIVAGIYWVATLVYVIFGQGHTAKWAVIEKREEHRKEVEMKKQQEYIH